MGGSYLQSYFPFTTDTCKQLILSCYCSSYYSVTVNGTTVVSGRQQTVVVDVTSYLTSELCVIRVTDTGGGSFIDSSLSVTVQTLSTK